jgi:hypothetical protein
METYIILYIVRIGFNLSESENVQVFQMLLSCEMNCLILTLSLES